jgi:hypothetical protein
LSGLLFWTELFVFCLGLLFWLFVGFAGFLLKYLLSVLVGWGYVDTQKALNGMVF